MATSLQDHVANKVPHQGKIYQQDPVCLVTQKKVNDSVPNNPGGQSLQMSNYMLILRIKQMLQKCCLCW